MKKIGTMMGFKLGLSIFCALLAMAGTTFAEDAKPAATAVSADDLKKALGLSIYLQGGYTYNGNASSLTGVPGDPGSENNLRVYDHKANSFVFDLAEISFLKDPAAGSIGYKVKISAGETAKLIHSTGLGDTGQDAIDLTEAYISYTAPVGKGLRFDAGKMGTFVGAEVMEAIDDANYSRSFLYNYSQPLTHTGVKASYVFNDIVNAALLVANGWDNATDNNDSKTYGVSVNVAAGDPFNAYINYLTGPEQTNDNHDNRSLLDLVATIKPLKPLTISLNYDNGKEDFPTMSATWSGVSGIVKYDFSDRYSLAVRGEYFDDKDGVRTGTVQKLKEITLTPEIRLNGGLSLRPEYRHDISDQQAFDNGTKKTQDTIALAAMYRW